MVPTKASVTVATWNVEWRESNSGHAVMLRSRLLAVDPDIACVTEGYTDFFADQGHVIAGADDWGYPFREGRRKVMLWSPQPWYDVDVIGSTALPAGRYVAGTTETSFGSMRVIGVCIPWRDAHVRTGRRDRSQWQDHLAFLDELGMIVEGAPQPTIMLGDFNQRHPRKGQPKAIHEALERAVLSKLHMATAGLIPGLECQAIDHIAHSDGLVAVDVTGLSNISPAGAKLSDHFGVATRLALAGD